MSVAYVYRVDLLTPLISVALERGGKRAAHRFLSLVSQVYPHLFRSRDASQIREAMEFIEQRSPQLVHTVIPFVPMEQFIQGELLKMLNQSLRG